MFWKLINGLLGRKSAPDGKVLTADRGERLSNNSTNKESSGQAADSTFEDLVRRAATLARAGRPMAALECYRACVQAYPGAVEAYIGMGDVLVDLWSVEEAVAAYGRALELAPNSRAIFSAVLFHLHYLAPFDRKRTFDLHRRFGEMMHGTGPSASLRLEIPPDRARHIRIGYVSPNFSRHSVGYFVEPVIRHHDRSRYEVYCYYTHQLADETTQRIRSLADGWRDIAQAPDDAVASMIGNDGIDILVDLAGHSKGNRLGVFARRPAPIQMTWLGYPDTTGLKAVDFRITDAMTDPQPEAERWHTERLVRIEDAFLCYQPPDDSPLITPHARSAPEVVFCSFNNIAKLNEEAIRVWSAILVAVPGSRILLKSAALSFPDTVDRILDCFERNGVASDRVELRGWIRERRHHLELYDSVDVALDTFPYNGTTTTCEALWMGVPVVALAGCPHMSRVGAAILRCAGLQELVADNPQDYANIAIGLAHDQARRRSLRTSLRTTLQSSALLDHAGFTRKLERHFSRSWTDWCDRQRAG